MSELSEILPSYTRNSGPVIPPSLTRRAGALILLPLLTVLGCGSCAPPTTDLVITAAVAGTPSSASEPRASDRAMDAPRKPDPIAPSAEPAHPGGLPPGVRYYLYVPKRGKADALAARLRGEGFGVETRLGADETNWLVLVSHPSLEEDTIDRLEEQFTKYAKASGGEYDGYER
jgi:Regulator of ribonuclease activity B